MKKRRRPVKARLRLLERKTTLFSQWLRVTFEKPYTLLLAAILPFLQAFLASIMMIWTNKPVGDFSSNLILFGIAALYYFSFSMNAKRAAKGSWIGLIFLILFGALGILSGKLFLSLYWYIVQTNHKEIMEQKLINFLQQIQDELLLCNCSAIDPNLSYKIDEKIEELEDYLNEKG